MGFNAKIHFGVVLAITFLVNSGCTKQVQVQAPTQVDISNRVPGGTIDTLPYVKFSVEGDFEPTPNHVLDGEDFLVTRKVSNKPVTLNMKCVSSNSFKCSGFRYYTWTNDSNNSFSFDEQGTPIGLVPVEVTEQSAKLEFSTEGAYSIIAFAKIEGSSAALADAARTDFFVEIDQTGPGFNLSDESETLFTEPTKVTLGCLDTQSYCQISAVLKNASGTTEFDIPTNQITVLINSETTIELKAIDDAGNESSITIHYSYEDSGGSGDNGDLINLTPPKPNPTATPNVTPKPTASVKPTPSPSPTHTPTTTPTVAPDAPDGLDTVLDPIERSGDTIFQIFNRASANLDVDGDRVPEIQKLYTFSDPRLTLACAAQPIIALTLNIELLQLIEHLPSAERAKNLAFYRNLQTWAEDLKTDGFCPRFLVVQFKATGVSDEDGNLVLALRRVFKAAYDRYHAGFAGAVLVGRFPEATILHRFLWKQVEQTEARIGFTPSFPGIRGADGVAKWNWLKVIPEITAGKTDLILSDFEGNWEGVYHKQVQARSWVIVPTQNFEDRQYHLPGKRYCNQKEPTAGDCEISIQARSGDVRESNLGFQDVFYVNDADIRVGDESRSESEEPNPNPPATRYFVFSWAHKNLEVSRSAQQLARFNPIARPQVIVSRINPFNVSRSPTVESGLINSATKKPALVRKDVGLHFNPKGNWAKDDNHGLDLLLEYFHRNHLHRTALGRGGNVAEFSYQAIRASNLENPGPSLAQATPNIPKGQASFDSANSSILDLARFFHGPELIKGIAAHSAPTRSILKSPLNAAEVAAVQRALTLPGPTQTVARPTDSSNLWGWTKTVNGQVETFTPSFADAHQESPAPGADASVGPMFYRTIWENKVNHKDLGVFYYHFGCEVTRPSGVESRPYTATSFGYHQNAEGILFYVNGLAFMGRSKTFNDFPNSAPGNFGKPGGRFGDGWTGYFQDSANLNDDYQATATRVKRPYFWNLLGDWTLKIKYQ